MTLPTSPAASFPFCRYETLAVATEAETRQDPDQPIKTGAKRLAVSLQGSGGACTTGAGCNTREKMMQHTEQLSSSFSDDDCACVCAPTLARLVPGPG